MSEKKKKNIKKKERELTIAEIKKKGEVKSDKYPHKRLAL